MKQIMPAAGVRLSGNHDSQRLEADVTYLTSIGNGIYARVNQSESLIEWYRRKQRECAHDKRDPRGTCYACGQKEGK